MSHYSTYHFMQAGKGEKNRIFSHELGHMIDSITRNKDMLVKINKWIKMVPDLQEHGYMTTTEINHLEKFKTLLDLLKDLHAETVEFDLSLTKLTSYEQSKTNAQESKGIT